MKVLRPLFLLWFGAALATGCVVGDDDDDVDPCVTKCEDVHEQCAIDCDDDECVTTCDDDLEMCEIDCE